jgi:hypothetical protein
MRALRLRGMVLGAVCAMLVGAAAVHAQAPSTLLPPACAGKSGAQLDQCVRDLTTPTNVEAFEPGEQKPNPAALMNCNLVNRADQGFCIAHNEIALECGKPKHRDFDACVISLIGRPQLPRAADCRAEPAGQRDICGLRNKVFAECLKDPWLYFLCVGEKIYAK